MKKGGNPDNFKGKNFKDHPENINRKGRPKKLPLLDDILAEVLGDSGDGKSEAFEIIKAMTMRAIRGDVRAAELILDRGYGKVKQSVDLDANIKLIELPVVKIIQSKANDD